MVYLKAALSNKITVFNATIVFICLSWEHEVHKQKDSKMAEFEGFCAIECT